MSGQPGTGFPGPIAALAPGFFWTRVGLLGVTAEELEALDRGLALAPERRTELQAKLFAAQRSLIDAHVDARQV